MNGIFVDVIESFYEMKDYEEAKAFIINYVKASNIPTRDRRQILYNVECRIDNLERLQQYITNSMLAFNKMRVK